MDVECVCVDVCVVYVARKSFFPFPSLRHALNDDLTHPHAVRENSRHLLCENHARTRDHMGRRIQHRDSARTG